MPERPTQQAGDLDLATRQLLRAPTTAGVLGFARRHPRAALASLLDAAPARTRDGRPNPYPSDTRSSPSRSREHGLRWGQVLGTGSRISGDAQGPSKEGSKEERNEPICRESALPSAFLRRIAAARSLHGKEGVSGSSPEEGLIPCLTLRLAGGEPLLAVQSSPTSNSSSPAVTRRLVDDTRLAVRGSHQARILRHESGRRPAICRNLDMIDEVEF